MRFMVLVKATKQSETGAPPSAEMLSQMGKFNQQLIDAGILLDANGLQPTSKAARVKLSSGKRTVVDGPFAEAKELVAGYWIWQCKSLAEAVEWVKRCPDPMPGEDSEIEIRPIIDLADLPDVPEDVRKMEQSFRSAQK
ncbi:MAG TPA: YciI family protein [Kofleriaceae bacterium]|nr:YciI family protein [Kofleriaceae bacterium]